MIDRLQEKRMVRSLVIAVSGLLLKVPIFAILP